MAYACHKCGKLHTDLDASGYCCYKPVIKPVAESADVLEEQLADKIIEHDALLAAIDANQDALDELISQPKYSLSAVADMDHLHDDLVDKLHAVDWEIARLQARKFGVPLMN